MCVISTQSVSARHETLKTKLGPTPDRAKTNTCVNEQNWCACRAHVSRTNVHRTVISSRDPHSGSTSVYPQEKRTTRNANLLKRICFCVQFLVQCSARQRVVNYPLGQHRRKHLRRCESIKSCDIAECEV